MFCDSDWYLYPASAFVSVSELHYYKSETQQAAHCACSATRIGYMLFKKRNVLLMSGEFVFMVFIHVVFYMIYVLHRQCN